MTGKLYRDQRYAAEKLGVSTRTLENWRLRGGGPKWYRIGGGEVGRVRYLDDDLDAFMQQGARTSTSEVA